MIKSPRQCKDCEPGTKRPALYPGPRCATHHRLKRRATSIAAHARRTEATYGLTAADYQALYAAQGGRCFICQRATGASKRLAVDHEHNRPGCEHPAEQGCHRCVRALLCGPCNREILGRLGIPALRRAIEVLTDPPARKVLLAS